MSPLRMRMIEDMKLAGLSPGTQATYIPPNWGRSLTRHLLMRRRRGAPAIELYKACSGANDGPWRQSGVLQEPGVQLLRGA